MIIINEKIQRMVNINLSLSHAVEKITLGMKKTKLISSFRPCAFISSDEGTRPKATHAVEKITLGMKKPN